VTGVVTAIRPDYTDQTGIFNPGEFGLPLTFIGAGGIGGSALPTLATMGFDDITVFDPDLVEPRNMASTTLYGPDDLYQRKVDVVQRELTRLGASVTTRFERFEGGDLDGIVISGVDTMAARRQIWDAVKRNPGVSLYLDGRIGGEIWTLIALEPFRTETAEWYQEQMLFSDEQAAPLPCTRRGIAYAGVALGAEMASIIAAYSRGERIAKMTTRSMGPDGFFERLF
jgi:hypothetical protein